jgi:hypothetical protein
MPRCPLRTMPPATASETIFVMKSCTKITINYELQEAAIITHHFQPPTLRFYRGRAETKVFGRAETKVSVGPNTKVSVGPNTKVFGRTKNPVLMRSAIGVRASACRRVAYAVLFLLILCPAGELITHRKGEAIRKSTGLLRASPSQRRLR